MELLTKLITLVELLPKIACRIKCWFVTAAQVLWNAALAFFSDEALTRAGSLAFTTLLSLIPLTTVALRIMSFYDVSPETQTQMEMVLAQYLLPSHSRNVVTVFAEYASTITQNVGAVGLLSFCLTLVLMARELEGHVLKICHKNPTWWTSILHYLAFVILVPAGVVSAFLVLHPLAAVIDLLPRPLASLNYPFILAELVVILLLRCFSDYALSWRACTFGALAAGVAAGAAWKGCALYFAYSASVSAYGPLSYILAFLLWLFVAWCCMLFGVQVAAKTQAVLTGGCTPCNGKA